MNGLPTSLCVEKWFTEEKDLPSRPTDYFYLTKIVDLETKEETYNIVMFVYWPVREPIDFDEWRFIGGSSCFARESSDNKYKVIAWGKLKLNYER